MNETATETGTGIIQNRWSGTARRLHHWMARKGDSPSQDYQGLLRAGTNMIRLTDMQVKLFAAALGGPDSYTDRACGTCTGGAGLARTVPACTPPYGRVAVLPC